MILREHKSGDILRELSKISELLRSIDRRLERIEDLLRERTDLVKEVIVPRTLRTRTFMEDLPSFAKDNPWIQVLKERVNQRPIG